MFDGLEVIAEINCWVEEKKKKGKKRKRKNNRCIAIVQLCLLGGVGLKMFIFGVGGGAILQRLRSD